LCSFSSDCIYYYLSQIKSDNPNVAQYKFGTPSYPTIFVMQSTASGGEIWLQQGLDRETRPKYTLQALALNDVGTQVGVYVCYLSKSI